MNTARQRRRLNGQEKSIGKRRWLWALAFVVLLFLVVAQKEWLLQSLYPAPYAAEITQLCRTYGEDSHLVMALIQTESKFRPYARSNMGAVGLMQIMPETAQWVVDQQKLADYRAEDLTDIAWNLEIGIYYLHWLRQQFPGSLAQILAAYNAGPTRVRTWLEEGVWDGSLEQVDDIPYKETREYVEKVLKAYGRYRLIYPQLTSIEVS